MKGWRWIGMGLGLAIMGAQAGWMDILKGVPGMKAPSQQQGLGKEEVAMGLKEALLKGVDTAVSALGREGGFLDRPQVRIPLPPSLDPVAKG
ncbi:MAG: DUF4197 family protein, partial [Gammaproteobacteria bacterium]